MYDSESNIYQLLMVKRIVTRLCRCLLRQLEWIVYQSEGWWFDSMSEYPEPQVAPDASIGVSMLDKVLRKKHLYEYV